MANDSENKIRKEMLTEFETQLDLIFNNFNDNKINLERLYKSISWLKNVWSYSRIDIKNYGSDSNNIKFFERDIKYDKDLDIDTPAWFQDENGKGAKIEFSSKKRYLHFQCVGDGKLEIAIRGLDYRNLNNERKPVYINCIKLSLNHDECLSGNNLIYHDKPFVFSKRCHNLERINLEIESKNIFYYYPRLKTFFINYDVDSFTKDYETVKRYIVSEKSKLNNNTDYIASELIEKEIPQDKTNIAIFGSCVSVDPFRTCYNNYKDYFNKMYEHQRSTFISLMNPKIDYSQDDIKYLLNTHDKIFIESDIRKDFNKEIFNHLDGIDYLIINLVHDIRWGVLSFEDTYITNSDYIIETNFYKNNFDKLRSITIFDNETEYFELWTECCDKFFDYLSNNYPNLKVILQKIELRDYYLRFDGTYDVREDFTRQAQKLNPYFKKLEQYIEDNHDVIVIPFPSDTSLDEGNIWGLFSTHYSRLYYENVFNKIKIHVLEEKLCNKN